MKKLIEKDMVENRYIWELDTTTIIIHWLMGHGKSMAATLISENDFTYEFQKNGKKYKFSRIYANFDIERNGRKICTSLKSFSDLKRIKFSRFPWVVLIDEMAIHANSKDARSENNRIISWLTFLARKINCSLIFISQRFKSIPVDQREVAWLILHLKKIKTQKGPKFIVEREQRLSQNRKLVIWKWNWDMISHLNYKTITYNQLSTSTLN